jgi:hypothetical protein
MDFSQTQQMDFSEVPPEQKEHVDIPTVSKDSFYSAMLKGGNPVVNYQAAMEEYLQKGESSIVDNVKKIYQQDEDIKRKQIILEIMGDPEVTKEQKKAVLSQYAVNQTIPIDLRTKYAEKVAVENKTSLLSPEEFADAWTKKEEHIKEETTTKEISKLESFFAGIGKLEAGVAHSAGLISDERYLEAVKNISVYEKANPITSGLGRAAGLIGAAVPATILAGPTALGVAASATIASIVEGTAKYAERGLDKVTQKERLESAIISAGFTGASFALPVIPAATVIKAMLLNGAGNVVLGELERPLQNIILKAHPELQQGYNWENTTINAVAGLIIGGVFGRVKPTIEPVIKPDPSSPLNTTAKHNEEKANKLGASALLDETNKVAEALGENKASILANHYFVKADKELLEGAPSGIRQEIEGLTSVGTEGFVRTESTPSLYGKAVRDKVVEDIYNTIKSFNGVAYHESKSALNNINSNYFGTATYGKTIESAFSKKIEALDAAESLREQIPDGNVKVVWLNPKTNKFTEKYGNRVNGDFYVQWDYAGQLSKHNQLAFGADAVGVKANVPFLNTSFPIIDNALTSLARTPLRKILPAGDYLKNQWVVTGAFQGQDAAKGIEQPLLKAQRESLSALSRINGEMNLLNHLIRTGDEEAKVFTYGEVSQLMHGKNYNKKSVDRVFKAYAVERRLDELNYLYTNRTVRKGMENNGMLSFEINKDSPLYAKPISLEEVSKVLPEKEVVQIWDDKLGNIREITKEDINKLYQEGGTLARMNERVSVGSTYVHYAIIEKGIIGQVLPDFVLPKIVGHSPRKNEAYYFVFREPKEASIDGRKTTNPKELEGLRHTMASADTIKDANKLKVELQEKYPEYNWDIKRDKSDSNSILENYKLSVDRSSHSVRRGDRLESIDGKSKLVDPIRSRQSSVLAMANKAALGEWMENFESAFMKTYSRFVSDPRSFPKSVDDFSKPNQISILEEREFKNALTHFNYYRGIIEVNTFSEEMWKRGGYYLGEYLEKYSASLAEVSKYLGREAYPPQILRSLAFTLDMVGRAIQIPLQASQIVQAAFLSPKYILNPTKFLRDWVMLIHGGMFIPHGTKGDTKLNMFGLSRENQEKIISKTMGLDRQEYSKIVQAFKDSGLPYSVDTNLFIGGMYDQVGRNLVEGVAETAVKSTVAGIKAVPRGLKAATVDLGEYMNLAGWWLFAKERHTRLHPDIPWDSKQGQQMIAIDARRSSGEMTKAGEVFGQRGILAIPLQFLAFPYKQALSMTTSKHWTPTEKSRLVAGNLLFYGAAGVGLASLVDSLREEFGDSVPKETWTAIKGGIIDVFGNAAINAMLGDESETKLALSKRFSVISGGVVPYGEVLTSMSEKPFQQIVFGPSWAIVNSTNGRIPEAFRDISELWGTKDISTPDKIKKSLMEASEISTFGTDWMKYTIAKESGILVSSMANNTGLQADRKTTLAKLFGLTTYTEEDFYSLQKKQFDEDKEVKAAAQYIYNRAMQATLKKNTDPDVWLQEKELRKAYHSFIANNPDLELKLNLEYDNISRKMLSTEGYNVQTRIFDHSMKQAQEDLVKTRNFLRSSTSPQLNQVADRINVMANEELY